MKFTYTQDNITININDDNSVEVIKDGVIAENTKEALRQLSQQIGFEFDPNWNTQTFGRKVYDFLQNNSEDNHEDNHEEVTPATKLPSKFILVWLEIERKLEGVIVNGINWVVEMFRVSGFVGYFVFMCALCVYSCILYVSPVYYIIKLVVRIVMMVKKQYIPTPEEEKGCMLSSLKEAWKEYGVWKSSHKFMGFIGLFYIWLFVAYFLFILGIVYIPYSIIRGILESSAKVVNS